MASAPSLAITRFYFPPLCKDENWVDIQCIGLGCTCLLCTLAFRLLLFKLSIRRSLLNRWVTVHALCIKYAQFLCLRLQIVSYKKIGVFSSFWGNIDDIFFTAKENGKHFCSWAGHYALFIAGNAHAVRAIGSRGVLLVRTLLIGALACQSIWSDILPRCAGGALTSALLQLQTPAAF